jgi:glycosyltransferase involved in cell wall biosynthesis
MIVKDEEEWIGRCLNSVKNIVDEMIIVDTGSSDRTIEICNSYGARVYEFTWNESFSEARNYGLERATGDWILWLDADEEVDETSACRLRDILYFHDEIILSIHLVNFYGDQAHPDRTFNIAHPRLFRNNMGFRFNNRIHETLNIHRVMTPEQASKIKNIPIKIFHYGYMEPLAIGKKKLERNIKMLEKELEEGNYSPWIYYYIASEYYRARQYKKAFELVNQSIISFLTLSIKPPSLLYKLKYSILLTLGSFEGAWPGIEKAIALYPDYVDLRFYKGVILYAKKMYVKALEEFDTCLEMGEDNLQHLILKGVGSFQAWHYKGRCYEALGQIKEAAAAYIKSASLSPLYLPPAEALQKLCHTHPKIDLAAIKIKT